MTTGGKVSAVAWSLLVHAVIAAGFIVTVRYTAPLPQPQPQGQVIQAEAISAEALREREAAKERARQEELRRQREAAERAAAEKRRKEEEARQAELRRQEELRRKAEERRQAAEAERRHKAEEEARRKAEAERKRREEEARRKAEEEARRKAEAERKRREAEAAARKQREEQLLESLQAEEDRMAAIRSGKQAQWIGAIRGKIERVLVLPPNAKEDYYCEANVRQIPGGEVVKVTIGKCDDGRLARAVEAAIWKASPLPPPNDPSLFDQYVNIIFSPEE